MKNHFKIYTIVAATLLLLVVIVISTTGNSSVKPLPDVASNIPSAISSGLQDLNITAQSTENSISVTDYTYVEADWMLVNADLLTVPPESKLRNMDYILKHDNGSLQVAAFSGDNFTRSILDEDIPSSVVEAANQPW